MRAFLATLLSAMVAAGPEDAQLLTEGLRLYHAGALADAVKAFDQVIAAQGSSSEANPAVVKAHTYKGAALVGLGQEEPAKLSFRLAFALDPTLRLAKEEFPDRVIRVFEAARAGKTKSVLERPNETARKAGLGAGAVMAIVGGVVLAGGAAAVALTGEDPPASSTDISMRLEGSTPPAGSTISLAQALQGSIESPPRIGVVVSSRVSVASGYLSATLRSGATGCLSGSSGAAAIPAGGSNAYPVGWWRALTLSGACTPPFVADSLDVTFTDSNGTAATSRTFGGGDINYRFVP